MQNKVTTQAFIPQQLIAGIKNNENIEFFGNRKDKTVSWFKNGNKHSFEELNPQIFTLLSNKYNRDSEAKKYLSKKGIPYKRQVELYTYYLYGTLDHTPDVINGVLQECENYRHKADCISLNFKYKVIKIDNEPLNKRDLTIIDLIATDAPDKVIADKLEIAMPTLSFHKKRLFEKTGCASKTAVLYKSMKAHVIN